jgi:hypothetical protein
MSQTNEKLEQELSIAEARLNVAKQKLQVAKCSVNEAGKRSEELERANVYLRGVLGNRGP